jgi:hypothetical protein
MAGPCAHLTSNYMQMHKSGRNRHKHPRKYMVRKFTPLQMCSADQQVMTLLQAGGTCCCCSLLSLLSVQHHRRHDRLLYSHTKQRKLQTCANKHLTSRRASLRQLSLSLVACCCGCFHHSPETTPACP